jgi:membrane protease YdiL (CAAX protease family)
MASVSTQPGLEVARPEVPYASNAHRWIDLGLVLLVAFGHSILGSIIQWFHPASVIRSNSAIGLSILGEAIALLLFFILFGRQERRLTDIGLSFRWTDIPKGLGLAIVSLIFMRITAIAVPYIYFLVTLRDFPFNASSSNVFTASLWLLIPFLLLNPFFEEILVRGYLMTEWISLRGSAVLAAIISVTFQTGYHLYYGLYGAMMVGCGLSVFAIYFANSRRLIPVILAHMFWDLTLLWSKLHS